MSQQRHLDPAVLVASEVESLHVEVSESALLVYSRHRQGRNLVIGDPRHFSSSGAVMSYCGLTSALRFSADKQQRCPISKQRNPWLQTALIEAAKLAPRWNPPLAALHARELERGHRNRATHAVARKLAAYLLAVDKSGRYFQLRSLPMGQTTVLDKTGQPRAAVSAAIPISNLPTINRPFLAIKGAAQRRFCSRCSHQAVSRPAALP